MKIKSFTILGLAALLVIGLAACVRPASKAPSGLATPTGAAGTFPVPGTQDVMSQLEGFATQTAIAMQGGASPQATQPPEAQATPEVGTTPAEGAAGGTAAETPVPTTEAGGGQNPPATPEATTPPVAAGPTSTLPPIPAVTVPSSYKLRGGEFPFCIARRFNIDPAELLSANGLGVNTPTYAGLTLNIPKGAKPFPGDRALKAHPADYTVRAGDTVNSIACQYGDVDPNAILIANGLNENKSLEAGQTLRIP